MNNIEPIVRSIAEYLVKNPQLLAIFISIFLGLCYYLGDLIQSNYWQHNNLSKEKYFLIGFGFITNYIFVPATIFYIFYALINNSISLSTSVYFVSLVVLNRIIFKDIMRIGEDLIKFNNNNKIKAQPVLLYSYIIMAVIFTALVGTRDIILLIGTMILILLIVTRIAILSSLHYQSLIAEIKFIDHSEPKKYRLIEFIEKGTFLKLQDINQDCKYETVFTIPTSRIEYIKSQGTQTGGETEKGSTVNMPKGSSDNLTSDNLTEP